LAKGRYFKYFNLLFYNRPSHHSLQWQWTMVSKSRLG
jgi:hypothetical protein